jgi:hypothetical protein
VRAHDFVPKEQFPPMCEVCTNWEDNERHHGVHSIGRTSWGDSVIVTPELIERLAARVSAPQENPT